MVFQKVDDIITRAKSLKNPSRVVIAGGDYELIVKAAKMAEVDGFGTPIFVGNGDKITALLKSQGSDPAKNRIIDTHDPAEAAFEAVRLVREGEADGIIKGMMTTSQILRAVLNKETGLPHKQVITQGSFYEIPGYHKLVVISDGAIIPYPTLEQKISQIESISELLRNMGYDKEIKVAVLCASEEVNSKITESVDAAELKRMNREDGAFKGCIVEGPISLDIAMVKGVAEKKGFQSEVAGDPDVLLFPSLAAGNLVAKTLTSFSGAVGAGMVLGAGVPISITSRAATLKQKYLSLALAAIAKK